MLRIWFAVALQAVGFAIRQTTKRNHNAEMRLLFCCHNKNKTLRNPNRYTVADRLRTKKEDTCTPFFLSVGVEN